MPLTPGSSFGRFRILQMLGAGAMGEVYLSEDPEIDRRVAIKTVRVVEGGGVSAEDLRARMRREAKAAGRLIHPHVVTLFEAGEVEDTFYLVFEYVEGQDLAARMRAGKPLPLADVLRIARQTAAGLAAAHRRGIVHRDIKPSNLLIADEDGSLKISDFGIAKLTGQATGLTVSGSIVGTPQYLSPEQVRAEEIDGRSDLFSLGVVLYELLAGRRPFEGETISTLVFQVLSQDPKPLEEIRPALPARLASAVMRLLAKEPAERFPTADALDQELGAIEKELAASTLPTPTVVSAAAEPTVMERQPSAAGVREPGVEEDGGDRLGEPPAESAFSLGPALRDSSSRWAVLAGAALLALGISATLLWSPWSGEPEGGTSQTSAVDGTAVPHGVGTRPDSDRETKAPETEAPGIPDETVRPPSSTGRDRNESAEPAPREVSGAVIFHVTPAEAADQAVLKVDGLVRGPAANSLVTLSPGLHRLDIVAAGFEPVTLLVRARQRNGTSELPVRMTEQ